MRSTRKLFLRSLFCLACLCMAAFFAVPAHAATMTKTHTPVARPLTSGGGCYTSSDGRVGACISVNGNHYVAADSYINGPCATAVYERIYDVTTGASTGYYYLGRGCGHFGTVYTYDNGDTYLAAVFAYFSDYNVYVTSPYQYG